MATPRGAAMVGTSAGFVVFLLLLFTAVQILFNLYANSMITAAAYDAATAVAGFDASHDRCGAVAEAEAAFVETLGEYGRGGHASLVWNCTDPEIVSVRVTARHPTILPGRLTGLIDLGRLDRTISVRVEEIR